MRQCGSDRGDSKLEMQSEKPLWKKEVKIDNSPNAILYDTHLCYENLKTPNIISQINIYKKGKQLLSFQINPGDRGSTHPKFLALKQSIQSLGFSLWDNSFYIITDKFIPSEQPENAEKVLNLLFALEKFDKTTQQDIYEEFQLKTPEQVAKEQAFKLIEENNLAGAAQIAIEAQNQGYFSVISDMVEFLSAKAESSSSLNFLHNELYNLCKNVIAKNPYYYIAQNKLAHLALLQESESLDPEDTTKTETVLRHALDSKDEDLAAGMLSELSNLPLFSFKKAGCNADTIIELALKIRALTKAIEKTAGLVTSNPQPKAVSHSSGLERSLFQSADKKAEKKSNVRSGQTEPGLPTRMRRKSI